MPRIGFIFASVGISLALGLGGCTQSTDVLDIAKEGKLRDDQVVDQTKDDSGAKIIREKSSLSGKGTNISVLVNRAPITNYDIKMRIAFLKLRRIGGDRKKKATDELIDERLKLQEAAKSGNLADDAMVNLAFADFAKRNKMSPKRMETVLKQSGVTARHFKEFLRIQISWRRAVGLKIASSTRKKSQSDTLFSIRKSGEAKPETREYILQQIIFVVPRAKRKKLLKLRIAEANTFSQGFKECGETREQIKSLRDVSIRELGRMLEPELPPEWQVEVINTQVGAMTRPKETDKGVELIAVCSVRNVSDDRVAEIVTKSKEFSSLNSKGNEEAEKYLAEIRSKATIVYR